MTDKKSWKPWEIYGGLPREVYVLFAATTINGIGTFVFPFMVLYLTTKLGYSDAAAGIFLTTASAMYIPGSALGSKLADTYGRKKVMITFQVLASLSFLACGFMGTSQYVPWIIMLNLFFDGACDPARSALQTDVTNLKNRQTSFALTYLGHNLGYMVGPMIAGFLFYSAPQWLFFGNGIVGLISIILVAIFIPESKPSAVVLEQSLHSDSIDKAERGGLFRALLTRPRLIFTALSFAFLGLAYSMSLFALPLTTVRTFGTSGASLYGTIMSLNAIVVVIGNPIIIQLIRSRNKLGNLSIGGLFYVVGFTLMGYVTQIWMYYVLAVVYTIGEIISATNVHTYIADHTPMSHRSRFSAIMPVIMGTGSAVAPMLAGSLSAAYGLQSVWPVIGCAGLIGSTGYFILYLIDRRKSGARV
ncbi:MFS transporter [Parasphaerochaeta coccoides]|uniref:Major facilitator superfamily MFS_1 n=1 Tax=Parasphaerochaeta coccoides (strain ATCC BAA-1237 / DSM 17374 / SPN1) TaxID=760011 RepID=F4GHM2_PARC1|nr:MFS transporter [Parasphaerochaeta coccoides]AEC01560.1 major facilitator superfamily MFS_1 [Parasphaerochaeta coccoides DSM 17374]